MRILEGTLTFEWDKGNKDKNFLKHRVTNQEAEEIFFDPSKKILKNDCYEAEERYLLIGMTKKERLLFIVFTLRGEKIRVISARDLNKKERFLYEEQDESS